MLHSVEVQQLKFVYGVLPTSCLDTEADPMMQTIQKTIPQIQYVVVQKTVAISINQFVDTVVKAQ